MDNSKHACMLPKPLCYYNLPPNARCYWRFRSRLQRLMLPCEWHRGSAIYIRSRKSLEMERDRQLRSGHHLVFHPYSPLKFYWSCFVMVANLFASWYMPWQVFYHCPNPADPIILATDFISFCDIIVLFNSGYTEEDNKQVILDPKLIALHYIKGTFIFDLIAALPFQLYQPFNNCEYPTHTLFFPLKALNFYEARRKTESFFEQLDLPYPWSVLIVVAMKLLLFFHWLTYLHYQLPSLFAHFLRKEDTAAWMWLKRCKVGNTSGFFEKYVSNLYFVCGLCIGAGYYSPVNAHVCPEMILNAIMGIGGGIFLTYCFMTLLRLSLYWQYQKHSYESRVQDLEKYISNKRLPKSLHRKIQQFLSYKFSGNYLNEEQILGTINEQIKQDINMHSCKRLVANVPPLRDLPVAVVNAIIFSLKQETLVPGQTIQKFGEPSERMCFISYGTLSVSDEHGRELTHLNDGAYFGDRAILNPGAPAVTTITALEITEIFVLNSQDFQTCIQPYPHLKRRMEETRRNRRRR
ncbi:potassium/sodium hyperpolarization-activated cyclic nucleotide-gated channel 1-like [Choristoneura fumiferana]|uniref:potassium/sodium hyperpolarization-activated cyclic nucleotide-gated channel 1-like n=1 Tax=Choristoneura fumiferana TaxID=7141 RepID=UPI003D158CAA